MPKTNRIVNIGLLSALAVLLTFIHFPILPQAPFLLYDPGDIPILIGGFMMGPGVGLIITLITSVLMALLTGQGGPIGALMHFLATGAFVATSSLVYIRNHTRKGALLGMALGGLAMTLIMIPANLIITPIYMGAPIEAVLKLLLPAIIPFNLLKALINSAITFIIYKTVVNFLRKEWRGKYSGEC